MSQLRSGASAPRSPFPLLPLRTGVLFPGTVLTLPVGRARSVALLNGVHAGDVIGVIAQRDPKREDPRREDLHDIGTFARVVDVTRVSNGFRLVIEGLDRFALTALVDTDTEPYWRAEGAVAPEFLGDAEEARLLAASVRERAREIGPRLATNLAEIAATSRAEPGLLADQIAGALGLPTDKEMEVLAELRVAPRLQKVAALLSEAAALADLKKKIDGDVRRELGKGQREAILREQLRAIQKELAGGEQGEDELSILRRRLDEAGLPEEARAVADRELRRLEAVGPQSAEHNVIRTYLEWIADLPWSARAAVKDDLDAVQAKLDEDHRGLDDVKRRILEHMAVLKLTGQPRATILCFAGPPGVGKTSLGQSIADATGRPFVRISLGGVHDEAELRGHRRTYVGALPGRIVHALKKAKVKNPVVLLDEVDKLGAGWRGSPEAALLEVLDPEQNRTFVDHYMELPFDLSEVVFLCTVNDLGALSAPLRDRLEVIELSGYTPDEKIAIARSHLVPKQIEEHAIDPALLTITDDALAAIVRDYTREAGVRQLGREIKKLCRAVALEVARAADGKAPRLVVEAHDLGKYLGKVRFFSDVAERTSVPGVATGLAWTPVGGDILFIETSRMPGKGRVEITGQLGDVMKESARAALSYVRSHAGELGVDTAKLETEDLHIHVPAGGVPKDGPSAGVTMFTALTSLLSGRRVRSDTAMTGECTLRGRVLPVGGIKSKVLAAHRAGITRIVLPQKNARDAEEIPKEVRAELELIFVEDMSQVIAAALEDAPLEAAGASGAGVPAAEPAAAA
ncbi:endopeptidase La [Sorangium cellulosum]|uniref:Lon protease n=1 Tax=Sorangium cellulosum TaxID=56 RepID=A0A150QIL6_SORCE|nr:endopeptidase La [Sorangium cellulosum]KYF67819.1 DNA-binding protein [Sorangium cellulosum]